MYLYLQEFYEIVHTLNEEWMIEWPLIQRAPTHVNKGASAIIFKFGDSIVTDVLAFPQCNFQVDYILGDNPLMMSYMVGYGARYPQRIHHRGSSLPSVQVHPAHIGCKAGSRYFLSPNPNPNLLVGAVVGGPNSSDAFPDSRPFFQESEPTTYINAPLVGLLAYFSAHYWFEQQANVNECCSGALRSPTPTYLPHLVWNILIVPKKYPINEETTKLHLKLYPREKKSSFFVMLHFKL